MTPQSHQIARTTPPTTRGDSRTPAEHRAAVEAWRASAPSNDSDILPRKPRKPSAKKLLSYRLAPILRWREILEPTEILSTNFLKADNDNAPEADGGIPVGPDCEHRIRPSEDMMMAALRPVDFRSFRHANGVGREENERSDMIPCGGDIEYRDAKIVRLGRLRFSSGDAMESCLVRSETGDIIPGEVRMPAGALLWSTDAPGAALGPGLDIVEVDASNSYFARMFLGALSEEQRRELIPSSDLSDDEPKKDPRVRFVKAGRTRRQPCAIPNPPLPPTSMPFAEARAFAGLSIQERDMKPALPFGSARLADSFVGMQTKSSGKSQMEPWQDVSTTIESRQEFAAAKAALTEQNVKALNAIKFASNYSDIGKALGHSGEYARRVGKRQLIAANDNLASAFKKFAS